MKKLFGLLTFILIGLINFGYCDFLSYPFVEGTYSLYTYSRNQEIITNGQNVCVYGLLDDYFAVYDGEPANGGEYIGAVNEGTIYCSTDNYWIRNNSSRDMTVLYGTKPITNSLECQTEYNLIPISDVDQNYCVNNNLCPSQGDCPDIPGSGDLQYSNIYINDILHPGRQNIFINIPDYITWDYSQNEVDFNVYVGSGYDQDYIDSIISINSYRPDSGDFTNIFVSGLTLVFPYIVIVLFIVFVRRLLKRIFR